jgi:hypothetical protein
MLLPFDLRPDREGWTVWDVATDTPAFLEGFALTGLSLDDAEQAVKALNDIEIRCEKAARRQVADERLMGRWSGASGGRHTPAPHAP